MTALPPLSGLGAVLQVSAALLWLPQAAAVAFGVGGLLQGVSAHNIVLLATVIVCCGLLRVALDYAGSALCHRQAMNRLTDIRLKGLCALEKQSPVDKERVLSGEAASLLTEQTNLLLPFLSRFGAVRLKAMLLPLAIFVVIAPFSWVAPLILLFCLPPIPLFAALIGWRAKQASEKQLAETTSLNGFLLDRLRGLSALRSLNALTLTARQFRALAENLRHRTMNVLRVAFLTSAMLELFSALGVAFMAVFIGFHLLGELPFGAWGGKLTLGEGLFILMLAPAFFEPLRELSALWHDKATANAAWEALQKLEQPRMEVLQGKQGALLDYAPSLAIYPNKAVPMRIDAGANIALWGMSGSGKTQLLAAIAGLYPFEGTIAINGTTLNAETAQAVRKTTAWLGARPYFKAGSVRENLGLYGGAPSAKHARLLLDRVGLHTIPENRFIGEDGAGLSGGEALRLALAQLYGKPDAMLVLADEPTAHLDRPTADAITALLLAYAQGKTMLVATHDAALARRMDAVISLDGTLPYDAQKQRRQA